MVAPRDESTAESGEVEGLGNEWNEREGEWDELVLITVILQLHT